MSRKTLLLCAVAIFSVVTISLVGNIITIGDKAAEIHPWLGWGFYIVLGLFLLCFVVVPTLKFIFTPELKGDERNEIDQMESDELRHYIKRLSLSQQERELFATAERATSQISKAAVRSTPISATLLHSSSFGKSSTESAARQRRFR